MLFHKRKGRGGYKKEMPAKARGQTSNEYR